MYNKKQLLVGLRPPCPQNGISRPVSGAPVSPSCSHRSRPWCLSHRGVCSGLKSVWLGLETTGLSQVDHLQTTSPTTWMLFPHLDPEYFRPIQEFWEMQHLLAGWFKLAISSKLASLFTPQEYKVAPPKKNPTCPTWEPKTFAAGNAGCGQWINLNTLPTKLTFYPDLQLYQIRILKSASHNLPYPPPSRIWKEKIANMETKIWSEAGSSSIQQKISSTWNWSYSFFKYK